VRLPWFGVTSPNNAGISTARDVAKPFPQANTINLQPPSGCLEGCDHGDEWTDYHSFVRQDPASSSQQVIDCDATVTWTTLKQHSVLWKHNRIGLCIMITRVIALAPISRAYS
jgi:hypothetical protein